MISYVNESQEASSACEIIRDMATASSSETAEQPRWVDSHPASPGLICRCGHSCQWHTQNENTLRAGASSWEGSQCGYPECKCEYAVWDYRQATAKDVIY